MNKNLMTQKHRTTEEWLGPCALTTVTLLILFFPAAGVSGWFGPPDFDDCILEHMEGVTSNHAVSMITGACRRASKSKDWFGPSGIDKCILENMKGVASDRAASLVVSSCRRKNR